MIHNEAETIRAALGAIEGVQHVTRGWPKRLECLQCIAVTKAADTPVDFRDDRAHLAELEYYVRVFADSAQQADAIAVLADAAMEALGYTRTFSYDDDDGRVRIAAMRYRKYV